MQDALASADRPGRRRPEKRRRERPVRGRGPMRFLGRAGLILVVVWLPAAVGCLGVRPLSSWAVAYGYLDVGWLLPALLVRAAWREWARERGVAWAELAGWLAGAVQGSSC